MHCCVCVPFNERDRLKLSKNSKSRLKPSAENNFLELRDTLVSLGVLKQKSTAFMTWKIGIVSGRYGGRKMQ